MVCALTGFTLNVSLYNCAGLLNCWFTGTGFAGFGLLTLVSDGWIGSVVACFSFWDVLVVSFVSLYYSVIFLGLVLICCVCF